MTQVIIREIAPSVYYYSHGYEFEYRQCIYTGIGKSVEDALEKAKEKLDKLKNPPPPKSPVHVFEI